MLPPPRKEKNGVIQNKPVPKVTGKRKRLDKDSSNGLGTSIKLAKISRTPGNFAKGSSSLEKASTSKGKENGLSRKAIREVLKTQKVLRERLFDPANVEMPGMLKLLDWVKF